MHIHEVLSFSLASQDYKEYFEPLNTIYDIQIAEIATISNDIEKNFSAVNTKKIFTYEFLTYTALIDKKIKQLLERINLLSSKLTQFTEDHFHQYIPKASLARRYSNKSITYFLDEYINNLSKQDKKIVIVWGTHNRYRAIKVNQNMKMIENTFWFYELSRLIPLLIHEAGHFHGNNTENTAYKQEMLKNTENEKNQELRNIIISSNIHEEIFADIFALQHLGASYILAFFYTQIFNSFDRIYYDNEWQSCIVPNPSSDKDKYARKSFEIFTRLLILIELYQDNCEDKTDSLYSHITSIQLFIHSIYPIEVKISNEYSLATLYRDSYPHWYKKYKDITTTMLDLKTIAIASLQDREEPKHEKLNFNHILATIWKKHLINSNEWVHPNFLRKNLLDSMELPKDYKHLNEMYTPYELTFYKLRTDHKNDIYTISKLYQSSVFFQKKTTIPYQTFGIYSYFSLTKKHDCIERDEIKNFLDNTKNVENNHPFYTQKIPLSLLRQNESTDECSKSFGLIMQLQLRIADAQNIKEGLDILIYATSSLKYYKLFKSLGPADFILVTQHHTIEEIYTLKEQFSKQAIFRKTFSTIFIEKESEANSTLNDDYQILSKLRTKNITSIQKQLTKSQNDGYIKNIHLTSGVTDYTIEWCNTKPTKNILQEIEKYTINTSSHPTTTDIQTFIQQRYIP